MKFDVWCNESYDQLHDILSKIIGEIFNWPLSTFMLTDKTTNRKSNALTTYPQHLNLQSARKKFYAQ